MENTLVSTNKYVILSHCWGPDPDIAKLTTKNTKEMEKEIEISSLPKNFIDAITVSRGLGFQYLWVDSLCILQDSEDDWAAESPQMGQYYQGAELMISSVTSSCAFRGFLNPREADFEAAKLDYDEADVFLRPVLADSTTIVDIDKVSWSDLRPKIHEQPLNTRAWALQERLFSRRILYFSRQQMIWCCKSSVLTEGGQLVNTPSPSINGNGVHQNRLAIDGDLDVSSQYWDFLNCGWPGIVERYTNRSITYTSDRLPGVSGLAVHFSSTIPVNYAAGLWHGSPGLLEASLLWRRVRKRDKSRVQLRAPTLANNGSPSWSWSYLEAEVRFQEYSRQKFNLPNLDPYFESIETTLATNNSFGQVSGGKITLEGFVHKYAGPSSFEGAEAKRYQEDSESDRHSDLARTLISIFDVPEPGRCWEDGNYVMLFIGQYRDYILTDLTSQEFLILRAIKSMPDHYQRIGVAYTGAWRELLAIEGNKEWTKQRLCLV